jgi:hypothetical protein
MAAANQMRHEGVDQAYRGIVDQHMAGIRVNS